MGPTVSSGPGRCDGTGGLLEPQCPLPAGHPPGRLAVIGLAAHGSFGDYLADAPGIPVNLVYRAVYGKSGSGAPVKDPEMTWAQVRAAARRLLPRARYRLHLLWRYSLLWTKPRS